jgi:hypothetical protein
VAAGQVIKVRVNLKSKSAARCLRTVLNRRSATWPVCAARGALCTSGWAPCTLADTASAASAGTRREREDAAGPPGRRPGACARHRRSPTGPLSSPAGGNWPALPVAGPPRGPGPRSTNRHWQGWHHHAT